MLQDFGLTRFPEFAGQKHFVDDGVDFVEVEDEVELADVVEILVEDLDEVVDGLQIRQVVVTHIHADAEVETSVAAVDDLEVAELDEVGVLGVADGHDGVDLLDQLLLLAVVEVVEPLGEACLARAVLDQDEADHRPRAGGVHVATGRGRARVAAAGGGRNGEEIGRNLDTVSGSCEAHSCVRLSRVAHLCGKLLANSSRGKHVTWQTRHVADSSRGKLLGHVFQNSVY